MSRFHPMVRRFRREGSSAGSSFLEGMVVWLFLWMVSLQGVSATKVAAAPPVMVPLIPHHVQVQRRLSSGGASSLLWLDRPSGFSRRAEALQVGALYHGYGTHYVDVWVGTPPQRQTVIVDTGSSLTAFPCGGCPDCGFPDYHIDSYFDYEASETFQKLDCGDCDRGYCDSKKQQCKLSMSYQEGSSWYAFEAKDTTYVGGPHNQPLLQDSSLATEDMDPNHASHFAFPLSFGCQYRLTGLFKTQLADGIMGMEYEKSSYWYQMYAAGKMGDRKQFSLCFSHPKAASREGTEAGAMTLGGTEPRLHKHEMVYTQKQHGGKGFFSVHVRKIYLRHSQGGEGAQATNPKAKIIALDVEEDRINSGGVIVDSGTTDTYWVYHISSAFSKAFQELSGREFAIDDKEIVMSDEEVASMPTILFQLSGDKETNQALQSDQVGGLAGGLDPEHPYDVILALPPSHYMEHLRSGNYAFRFFTDESSGSVLGANSMTGHDVLFDADQAQIGWAESDCDYHKLVTDAGYTDVLEAQESSSEAGGTKDSSESSGPTHDDQSPMKDSQVAAASGFQYSCESLACKGAASLTLLVGLFGMVAGLQCLLRSGNRRINSYEAAPHRPEVELATNHSVPIHYLDDDDDDEEEEAYLDEPEDA